MRTLIIPDMHLKPHMLLKAEKLHKEKFIDEFVFLGDYFDDWNQTTNVKAYSDTVKALSNFKKKHNCIFLLGNHDVPYLINQPQHYSAIDPYSIKECRDFLISVKPQICHISQGWMCSHAGIDIEHDPENKWFTDVSAEFKILKNLIEDEYSPLWIRPQNIIPHNIFSKQIVGHTPTQAIKLENDIYYTDTWSTYPNGKNIGTPSFVLIDEKEIKIVKA